MIGERRAPWAGQPKFGRGARSRRPPAEPCPSIPPEGASSPAADSFWQKDPLPAHTRAMIYHALAEALAQPAPGIGNLLREAVEAGARVLGSDACQRAVSPLAECSALGLESLQQGYARLMANPGGPPLALYESLFRYGRLAGSAMWEVAQCYQALGLAPADGELADEASVELAFLGHLAAAQGEAWEAGDSLLAARLREKQSFFLHAHASAWLPKVGEALAASDDLFYAAVGRLLCEFLSEEMIGRERNGRGGGWLPFIENPEGCTLCGLCAGICPQGALRMMENGGETALTLNPSRCAGCGRCVRICPQGVLRPSPGGPMPGSDKTAVEKGDTVLRQSARARCPGCGRPTVSQAELKAVFARLQPDPTTWQRLTLCVDCKGTSWGTYDRADARALLPASTPSMLIRGVHFGAPLGSESPSNEMDRALAGETVRPSRSAGQPGINDRASGECEKEA